MRNTIFITLFILFGTFAAAAQVSWLDRPLTDWNTSATVPRAPRDVAIESRCRSEIRTPESLADRALTRAGWSLYGAAQTYGSITVINAMSGTDGMCRPSGYNTFVFSGSRFIGTLSPENMVSREDGSLITATLWNAKSISAEFNRYTSRDALCCPSQKSSVTYEITGNKLKASEVNTEKICSTNTTTPETGNENAVTGTITYRDRSALPRNSVVTVKLIDTSRADAAANVITEQTIDPNGKQVPFAFSLEYKQSQINRRNRYSVRAEIKNRAGRLLYTTDTAVPVLTYGNPSNVEIVVTRVGQQEQGNNDQSIQGTATYRERIALQADSDLTVELVQVDAQGNEEDVVAQTTFSTGTRQVPISFELPYAQSSIETNGNYVVRARISHDGETLFDTAEPQKVNVRRGANNNNVRLVLVKAETGVKGKSVSLSRFGTGTFSLEGRSNELLINARADVKTDGTAEVKVSGLLKSFSFEGVVTQFTDDTITINVKNSGDADAGGTIEIRYSGESLRSITTTDLVLDSQKASIRF
jgi:uncharacterized lipoprotein YbaY